MTSFPTVDVRLGALLVVNDVGRSRDFYRDVLGAKVLREFEGSFCQMEFQKSLLFIVAGGGPTKDKPGITLSAPTTTGTRRFARCWARMPSSSTSSASNSGSPMCCAYQGS